MLHPFLFFISFKLILNSQENNFNYIRTYKQGMHFIFLQKIATILELSVLEYYIIELKC